MRINIKSLKITPRTAVITIEDRSGSDIDESEVFAFSVLLGDYNKSGRSIPLERFKEMRLELSNLIYEVKQSI